MLSRCSCITRTSGTMWHRVYMMLFLRLLNTRRPSRIPRTTLAKLSSRIMMDAACDRKKETAHKKKHKKCIYGIRKERKLGRTIKTYTIQSKTQWEPRYLVAYIQILTTIEKKKNTYTNTYTHTHDRMRHKQYKHQKHSKRAQQMHILSTCPLYFSMWLTNRLLASYFDTDHHDGSTNTPPGNPSF